MYNARPPFRPPGMPPFPPNMPPGMANGSPPVLPPFPPNAVRPPFAPNFSPQGAPASASPLPLPLPPRPAPAFVKESKPTSVFVGGIPPGINDATLRNLLNTCGPLRELKRVSGASGKPQAFGFALYDDPNAVMRVIRCLNGVELPDGTGHKALVVKVDDKTKGFLDEFEQTVGRTEEDETADATARKTIAHIVARLTDPNAVAPPGISKVNEPFHVIVPAHLQDLKEGDLPENQRVAVLDQIAVFREAAARKEREKKTIEKKEPHSDYGYGSRSLPRAQAQGYEQPAPFVRAQAPETKVESSRTDQEEEELRLARKARERDHALRDRERKVEHRERMRIDALNRELGYRQQQADAAANHRARQSERLATWDDDRSRDQFYTDRARWRDQRQPMRAREYEDDVRDRQAEQEEARRIEKESEAFLERQMQELSAIKSESKDQGLLSEDAAPVRLALAAVPKAEPAPRPAPPVVGVTLEGDDEEEARRKPKTFVKLDDDAKAGMSAAERAALRNAQLLDIRATIPADRAGLFAMAYDVDEATIKRKLVPFVNARLMDYLGEADEDVVEVILEAIRGRMSGPDMVDEFEGPLGDEAGVLVEQLWRQLAFESAALKAGLDSGSMTA